MEETSTERFLRLLNQQNIAVAAQEKPKYEDKLDPVRLQRDQERREQYGTLRARPHPGKRPRIVRNAFGYVDISEIP